MFRVLFFFIVTLSISCSQKIITYEYEYEYEEDAVKKEFVLEPANKTFQYAKTIDGRELKAYGTYEVHNELIDFHFAANSEKDSLVVLFNDQYVVSKINENDSHITVSISLCYIYPYFLVKPDEVQLFDMQDQLIRTYHPDTDTIVIATELDKIRILIKKERTVDQQLLLSGYGDYKVEVHWTDITTGLFETTNRGCFYDEIGPRFTYYLGQWQEFENIDSLFFSKHKIKSFKRKVENKK